MARPEQYASQQVKVRQNRYFSEEFKRKRVREIERNLITLAEVCREWEVSRTAVYKWIYKYSGMRKKGVKQVIETQSDTRKVQQLRDQVKELQRIIGEKQLKVDFLEKMIDLTEKEYGIDVKKKFTGRR